MMALCLQIAGKIVESFDSHGLSAAQIARTIADGVDEANLEGNGGEGKELKGNDEEPTAMRVGGMTSATREFPKCFLCSR